jgi:hypothetical protein
VGLTLAPESSHRDLTKSSHPSGKLSRSPQPNRRPPGGPRATPSAASCRSLPPRVPAAEMPGRLRARHDLHSRACRTQRSNGSGSVPGQKASRRGNSGLGQTVARPGLQPPASAAQRYAQGTAAAARPSLSQRHRLVLRDGQRHRSHSPAAAFRGRAFGGRRSVGSTFPLRTKLRVAGVEPRAGVRNEPARSPWPSLRFRQPNTESTTRSGHTERRNMRGHHRREPAPKSRA